MWFQAKTLAPQPWPWPERPRILVEHAYGELELAYAEALRQAGYSVAVCPGPRQDERCPLVCDTGCPLVDGADLIVSGVGPDVLEALRTRRPSKPLVVAAGHGPEELVASVREALPK